MVCDMFASPDRNGFSHSSLPPRRMRDVPLTSSGRSPTRISGPNEALRSLECARIEIVDALGDVVGELVGEREADAERRAVVADDIDAGDLRLLAGILGEGRRHQRRARRHRHGAVALVEPFRLHADLALRRLAALQPHAEHLHGIGEVLLAVGGRASCAWNRAWRPSRDGSSPVPVRWRCAGSGWLIGELQPALRRRRRRGRRSRRSPCARSARRGRCRCARPPAPAHRRFAPLTIRVSAVASHDRIMSARRRSVKSASCTLSQCLGPAASGKPSRAGQSAR